MVSWVKWWNKTFRAYAYMQFRSDLKFVMRASPRPKQSWQRGLRSPVSLTEQKCDERSDRVLLAGRSRNSASAELVTDVEVRRWADYHERPSAEMYDQELSTRVRLTRVRMVWWYRTRRQYDDNSYKHLENLYWENKPLYTANQSDSQNYAI